MTTPVPLTIAKSGSSEMNTGRLVLFLINTSKPSNNEPPPKLK